MADQEQWPGQVVVPAGGSPSGGDEWPGQVVVPAARTPAEGPSPAPARAVPLEQPKAPDTDDPQEWQNYREQMADWAKQQKPNPEAESSHGLGKLSLLNLLHGIWAGLKHAEESGGSSRGITGEDVLSIGGLSPGAPAALTSRQLMGFIKDVAPALDKEYGPAAGAAFEPTPATGAAPGPSAALDTEYGAPARATSGPAPSTPAPISARDTTIQNAQDIGVTSLPRAAVGGRGEQGTAAFLSQVPIAGTPMRRAAAQTQAEIEAALERSISDYGGATHEAAGSAIKDTLGNNISKAEDLARKEGEDIVGGLGSGGRVAAGEAARDDITNWIDNVRTANNEKAYDAIYPLIDETYRHDVDKLREAAGRLKAEDIDSATPDGQKVIAYIQDALQKGANVRNKNDPNGGFTFDGLKTLRTRLGERVNGLIAPEQGTSARAFDSLYAAATQDLRQLVYRAGVANGSGKKALAAFDAANNVAKEGFAQRDQLVKIIGRTGDSTPESIVDRIGQMASARGGADINRLQLAQKSVSPDTWNEVASAVLRRLGDSPEGFSAEQLSRGLGKMSDQGKDTIFGVKGTPIRDRIETLAGPTNATITSARSEIGKIIGAGADAAPVAIVDRLATMASAGKGADITRLRAVMGLIPADQRDALASALLRRMGGEGKKDGLSVATLRTAYAGLSEEGKGLIFGNDARRVHLEKLMDVAKHYEYLQRAANTSKTASAEYTIGGFAALMLHPWATVGGLIGNRGIATWLASPAKTEAAASLAAAAERAATTKSPADMRVYQSLLTRVGGLLGLEAGSDHGPYKGVSAPERKPPPNAMAAPPEKEDNSMNAAGIAEGRTGVDENGDRWIVRGGRWRRQ